MAVQRPVQMKQLPAAGTLLPSKGTLVYSLDTLDNGWEATPSEKRGDSDSADAGRSSEAGNRVSEREPSPPTSTTGDGWRVRLGDGTEASLTTSEIGQALQDGRVTRQTHVTRRGLGEWIELDSVPALRLLAARAAPAPAASGTPGAPASEARPIQTPSAPPSRPTGDVSATGQGSAILPVAKGAAPPPSRSEHPANTSAPDSGVELGAARSRTSVEPAQRPPSRPQVATRPPSRSQVATRPPSRPQVATRLPSRPQVATRPLLRPGSGPPPPPHREAPTQPPPSPVRVPHDSQAGPPAIAERPSVIPRPGSRASTVVVGGRVRPSPPPLTLSLPKPPAFPRQPAVPRLDASTYDPAVEVTAGDDDGEATIVAPLEGLEGDLEPVSAEDARDRSDDARAGDPPASDVAVESRDEFEDGEDTIVQSLDTLADAEPLAADGENLEALEDIETLSADDLFEDDLESDGATAAPQAARSDPAPTGTRPGSRKREPTSGSAAAPGTDGPAELSRPGPEALDDAVPAAPEETGSAFAVYERPMATVSFELPEYDDSGGDGDTELMLPPEANSEPPPNTNGSPLPTAGPEPSPVSTSTLPGDRAASGSGEVTPVAESLPALAAGRSDGPATPLSSRVERVSAPESVPAPTRRRFLLLLGGGIAAGLLVGLIFAASVGNPSPPSPPSVEPAQPLSPAVARDPGANSVPREVANPAEGESSEVQEEPERLPDPTEEIPATESTDSRIPQTSVPMAKPVVAPPSRVLAPPASRQPETPAIYETDTEQTASAPPAAAATSGESQLPPPGALTSSPPASEEDPAETEEWDSPGF